MESGHDGFVHRTRARVPSGLEEIHWRWRGGAERAVEGQVISFTPSRDPRVQGCHAYPKLRVLISRINQFNHYLGEAFGGAVFQLAEREARHHGREIAVSCLDIQMRG